MYYNNTKKEYMIKYIKKEIRISFRVSANEPVFTVSVVSRLLSMPVWMLKKFDREKLVCPKRSDGNDRLYSKDNLDHLSHYWQLMCKRNVKISGLKVIQELEEELGIFE